MHVWRGFRSLETLVGLSINLSLSSIELFVSVWRLNLLNSRRISSWTNGDYACVFSSLKSGYTEKIFWEVVILSITAYTPDYTPECGWYIDRYIIYMTRWLSYEVGIYSGLDPTPQGHGRLILCFWTDHNVGRHGVTPPWRGAIGAPGQL